MSKDSFEEKLKDLNLSNDELKRFSDAFQNEEFRKLFIQYAEELNDPTNRQLYEDEIRAAEEQRGSDVTFVHPKPGHVLKTTINGKTKCFINIATNEHVDKPSYMKSNASNGKQGVDWSLPHCLAGPHEDVDHDSKVCTVYDVIYSPDTYRMAETNAKFMQMIEDSALESVEKNYQCQLDRNNVKRLKMNFKGVPKATIIRRKKENHSSDENLKDTEKELKDETDDVIDKALSNAQNHKVVLTSHNRPVSHPPLNSNPTPHTDENGYTIPLYRIIHRGEFDMQDCTNSIVAQVRSMRPKELIVEVDLPLCASTTNVDLDVCERSLKLHCDSPKYSLDLSLPYPVRESDSHARFDKKQRKLLITLAVIKETPTVIEIDSDVEMNETNEQLTEVIPTTTAMDQSSTNEDKLTDVTYSSIPFEYKQGLARVALVLYVKNVDQSSFKLENDGQHITVQLISLGSGSYPLHHQLCLDFDEPMTFETAEETSSITFNEDNVLVLLKKTTNNKTLTQFSSGVHRQDMKINYFALADSTEKVNSMASTTTTVSKEDFLTKKSDSLTSTNSDQPKKLTKKQAKKLAKENRKVQATATASNNDENETLTKKIAKITLQPSEIVNSDQSGKLHSEEKDDKLTDITKVIRPNPSIYRRHLSESQADFESASNGEFKLKGILKNSTKYRSYSESFNDTFNGDFQGEEFVFERCSTTEDLTSSNENNSVTSPDSTGGGSSLGTTSGSSISVKHVTFNNQVSRKTFKPGGPVSGMKKLSSTQQRKLKKRKRQDSLNSQSSDQDDGTATKPSSSSSTSKTTDQSQTTKSAVQFTNPLIFELDN